MENLNSSSRSPNSKDSVSHLPRSPKEEPEFPDGGCPPSPDQLENTPLSYNNRPLPPQAGIKSQPWEPTAKCMVDSIMAASMDPEAGASSGAPRRVPRPHPPRPVPL